MKNVLLGVMLLVTPTSCGVSGPDLEFVVSIDQVSYTRVDGSAQVNVRIENRGERAAAVAGCPEPPFVIIERRVAGQWREEGSVGIVCLAIFTLKTVTITPGGSLEFGVNISTDGRHRLRVLVGVDAEFPDAIVTSGEFLVE